MSGYRERDAAKDTNTPEREVTATWHQARDDAEVRRDGTGDRPTAENRKDSRRLMRKVIDRRRTRPESSRDER